MTHPKKRLISYGKGERGVSLSLNLPAMVSGVIAAKIIYLQSVKITALVLLPYQLPIFAFVDESFDR